MKKTIAIVTIVLISCFVSFMLGYITANNKNNQPKENIKILQLKSIELTDLHENTYTLFQSNKPIIVVYYKTTCPYCFDEIESLSQNINKLNDLVDVFLISSEVKENIAEFSANFNANNLIFLCDRQGEIKEELHIKNYPSIFIFSKEQKLIKQFVGTVPINKIISEIPNE